MKKPKFENVYKWILIVGGIIGILAASILTIEKIHLAENPNYIPSCSLSPVVACSPVIGSWQGRVFGFPNPLIGIFGFTAVLVVGMTLLAGAKIPKRWYWLTFQAGTIFGLGFVIWLFTQSLYDIAKLCIYCMAVWTITIPIFWTTLAWNVREGHIKLKGKARELFANHFGKIIAVNYLTAITLIFMRFSDYFYSLIG
jgi:uncharacterized membrane protein